MIQKEDFKFYTDHERDIALEINPNMKTQIIESSGMWYFWGENVFKNLEKAIEFLKQFPALDKRVTTPGSRQYFTPVDVQPLVYLYADICSKLYKDKFDARRFLTSSIIANKYDQVYENTWIPHTDEDITGQLYLNDYNGGTALYKYKGYLSPQLAPDVVTMPDYSTDTDIGGRYYTGNIVDWKKFDGDNDWELYHVIPSKENCIGIFHGAYFHSTYTELQEDCRYVLSSFYHRGFVH